MPDSIQSILPHLGSFLLVLVRMTGLFVFAPFFGSELIPVRVRVLLAVTLTFCVYPLIPPLQGELTWASTPIAVGGELLIGLAIGFGAALPMIAIRMAGQLMEQQLGLGLAEMVDPAFESSADVLGRILFLTALVLFLLMDGHHALLGVLIGSFQKVPLGGYSPDGRVLAAAVGLLGSMTDLAVRVAAPLLCLVFLEAVAMGFVARTVPQLNILTAGFPLRILLGLSLLAVALAAMGGAFVESMKETLSVLARMFG